MYELIELDYRLAQTVIYNIIGPEPTVRLVRFWPDHFLLGARPVLVNAWD